MNIAVYGRSNCIACKYTKLWMDRLGLEYKYIDIDQDGYAARDVKTIMRKQNLNETLPLVVVSNSRRSDRWTGFKLDRIRGLRETGDY